MKIKQIKAQSGLSIFLSVIVMAFLIGLFVYLFALMGSELKDTTYTVGSGSVNNETIATLGGTAKSLSVAAYRNVVCTLVNVQNQSQLLAAGNYTFTACTITNLTGAYALYNVTYAYTYDADNTATDTMNATVAEVAGAVDWLPLLIVISAMIAIILLTVMIIVAIRGSGLMQGAGSSGSNKGIGTA
jgi:hypothetical protein